MSVNKEKNIAGKKRLIAVHLLNDNSGSPIVFRQSLESLKEDFDIHLFTSTPNGKGALSDLEGLTVHQISYHFVKNKWFRLFYFLWAQFRLFLTVFFFIKRTDHLYINTLLPFGAAIAGRWKGSKITYHVHEVTVNPVLLKNFLVNIAAYAANDFIYVSGYVRSAFNFRQPARVIYNSLPEQFINEALTIAQPRLDHPFTVLMLCSLKDFKGVNEFVDISRRIPRAKFTLVLNATEQEVQVFKKQQNPPGNCFIYPSTRDTLPFYKHANLVLNLSHPERWIETFGLTILEAMYCGIPVIVPEVGGPLELVSDGMEGYQISVHNVENIVSRINQLSGDLKLYMSLSANARRKAAFFSPEDFKDAIRSGFNYKISVQKMESAFHSLELK